MVGIVCLRLLAPLLLTAVAALAAAAAVWAGASGEPRSRPRAAPAQLPPAQSPPPVALAPPRPARPERIRWRRSLAIGLPWRGRLVRGVRLPTQGPDFFTWDPVRKRTPNRSWRRWGTDRLVRTVLRVLRAHRRAHPDAPRVGVGDLSRPRGGDFGPRYGALGHASHQNGLDAGVYYPRLDGAERRPERIGDIDLELARDLVDRFARAGAQYVFVGPATGFDAPGRVVRPLGHHHDHLHVRIRPARRRR